MKPLACRRCGRDEIIPTHQFLKFDTEPQYVCKACWEAFRRWFFSAERIDAARAAWRVSFPQP